MKHVIEVAGHFIWVDFWRDYEVVDRGALTGRQPIDGPSALLAEPQTESDRRYRTSLSVTLNVHGPLERGVRLHLQLFVCSEPEIVRAVLQKRSKKFFFPDLPSVRILLWGPWMLGGAPEPLPGLTTLVDP